MDGRLGRNRRRALAGALLSVALVASIAVFAATSEAAETARTIATLEKSCAPGAGGAPVFTIRNQSGAPGTIAQTISVDVYDRYFSSGAGKVAGPISIAAGGSYTFTAAGSPWKSAYKPDRQYYAFFKAVVHVKKKGKVAAHDELQDLKTHEFCACKKPTPTTSTTSSTSTTSTSTSTSTTTSTTSTSTTTTTIRF
jgi:hypothetical protein